VKKADDGHVAAWLTAAVVAVNTRSSRCGSGMTAGVPLARPGALLALCVSMATLRRAGVLAAPHAKGAVALPGGVVAGGLL
jgi:hypothetical protein